MEEKSLISQIENNLGTVLLKNDTYHFSIRKIEYLEKKIQLIYTDGLRNFEQKTNEKHEDLKHIEIYFCLPDYWDLSEEKNNWPVKWLNKIAEVPQKNNTWFGPGDTLPAGNDKLPLSDKMLQNHFILSEPILLNEELNDLIPSDKKVKFLAVIPIFEIELAYKFKNSAKVLLAKFQYKKHTELVDEYRESVIKKKMFGLF